MPQKRNWPPGMRSARPEEMRIFLDANILFSAAKSDGLMRRFLKELSGNGHQHVADGYVIAEARRNLERKFPAAVACLGEILTEVECPTTVSGPASHEYFVDLPAKDRPVLAGAIHHHCPALLTGDKMHFGALYGKTIAGTTVYSPQMLAKTLLDEERAAPIV